MMYMLLPAGILSALVGGLLWFMQERSTGHLLNPIIFVAIILILFGATKIGIGLDAIMRLWNHVPIAIRKTNKPLLWEWAFILSLIFIGSVSYTIAAYYHLNMDAKKWSFIKAFAIAVPFILIEYQFSIRGNYHAKHILGMNAVQITLLTMTFYFINSWLLSYFVLKQKIIWWRELLAFACVGAAFMLTTSSHK